MIPGMTGEELSLWRSEPGITLLRARLREFVYRPHAHEEYAIGVVVEGVQRLLHGGAEHLAPRGTIYTLNPGEVHAGEALYRSTGYGYRLVYLDSAVVGDILVEYCGDAENRRWFPSSFVNDPELSVRLARALQLQEHPGERLAADIALTEVVGELFVRHARAGFGQAGRDEQVVTRVREYLDAHARENPGLEELARSAGMSRYQLLRLFKRTAGCTPHVYLVQKRLSLARRAIEEGQPLVDVAAGAGFADQSHLTRQFHAAYGLTPGQYRAAVRT